MRKMLAVTLQFFHDEARGVIIFVVLVGLIYTAACLMALGFHQAARIDFFFAPFWGTALALMVMFVSIVGTVEHWIDGKKGFGLGMFVLCSVVFLPILLASGKQVWPSYVMEIAHRSSCWLLLGTASFLVVANVIAELRRPNVYSLPMN